MAQCLIVADDLTGANATGVLIKKNGYDTNTIISTEGFEQATIDSSECIIFPTDSRAIARDIAYTRVHNATRLFQSEQIHIYGKRIDSTLRGNLGAELDAMLDALGEEYIAISAPCFPESGRIVCGGLMLVNGVPLSKTAVANDPKTPVHTSVVADVFRQQSRHPVASVYLNEYTQGGGACAGPDTGEGSGGQPYPRLRLRQQRGSGAHRRGGVSCGHSLCQRGSGRVYFHRHPPQAASTH